MENIKLVIASPEYSAELEKFKQEIEEVDKDSKSKFAGCSRLNCFENLDDWFEFLEKLGNGLVSDMVPASVFLALDKETDRLVGVIDVRFAFGDEQTRKSYGNIGYSVRPDKRRLGHATEMIKLALEECKECGMSKVKIVCSDDNIGSKKAILRNHGELGGSFSNNGRTFGEYWIDLNKH